MTVRLSGGRTTSAVAAILAGLLAILLVAGYFFVRYLRLEEEQRLVENDTIARGVAAIIQAREEGYLNVLAAYAGRFRFREAVKRRDRTEALVHLRQIAESFPELDWPFLTDPDGVLWAIYPEAPELYGRSFAHRDWYRGVSREWRPYMSEVFLAARDQAPAVSLVMPIRSLDGKIIGIIGSAQRLENIRQWLLPIQIPGGHLYLVDRKRQFLFHRTLTGAEHLADYARTPVVERLLRGAEGIGETENPVERKVRLTAYRPIPSIGWGVVVQRSKNLTLQRTRSLIFVSSGAALLFAAALGVLGTVAIRNHHETVRALAALEEKTRQLQAAPEELVRKERLAILGQLAGGVSHELRNPLGVIKNSVYYLRMVAPDDERIAKHLQIIDREIATATQLISGLLDFARVTPAARVDTDLNALVRRQLDRMTVPGSIELTLD